MSIKLNLIASIIKIENAAKLHLNIRSSDTSIISYTLSFIEDYMEYIIFIFFYNLIMV